jgi:predicted butyrate kinase (DUF1464 family)
MAPMHTHLNYPAYAISGCLKLRSLPAWHKKLPKIDFSTNGIELTRYPINRIQHQSPLRTESV